MHRQFPPLRREVERLLPANGKIQFTRERVKNEIDLVHQGHTLASEQFKDTLEDVRLHLDRHQRAMCLRLEPLVRPLFGQLGALVVGEELLGQVTRDGEDRGYLARLKECLDEDKEQRFDRGRRRAHHRPLLTRRIQHTVPRLQSRERDRRGDPRAIIFLGLLPLPAPNPSPSDLSDLSPHRPVEFKSVDLAWYEISEGTLHLILALLQQLLRDDLHKQLVFVWQHQRQYGRNHSRFTGSHNALVDTRLASEAARRELVDQAVLLLPQHEPGSHLE